MTGARTHLLVAALIGLLVGACGGEPRSAESALGAEDFAPPAEAVRTEAMRWATRGTRATLRDLELRVVGLRRAGDRLRIDVVFENVSLGSYVLAGDLSGEDLVLVEVSGAEHPPLTLSGELRRIDDGAGLAPRTARQGVVEFPFPGSSSFQLTMPGFAPLALSTDRMGGSGPVPSGEGESALPDAPTASEPAVPGVAYHPDRDAVAQLLADQAHALARRDFDAYLATFTPAGRAVERHVFEERRKLPLAAVSIELLDRPMVREGDDLLAWATLTFRFDGVPADNPFVHLLRFVLADTASGWRVDEIRDNRSQRLPWRQGELVFHRSNHFLIYTHPTMQRDLVELARDAEAAYAELYRRGLPMASGYVVRFACDDSVDWRPDRISILGRATVAYELGGDRLTVHSRALFINACLFSEAQWIRLSPEQRFVTMTHELAHLALAESTRPYSPLWLVEGAAVYFSSDISFDETRSLVRRGMRGLDLDSLTRAWDRSQAANDEYLFSGNVVRYLVERHGLGRMLDFYGAFAALSLDDLDVGTPALQAESDGEPVTGRSEMEAMSSLPGARLVSLTSDALEEHFGVDLPELDEEIHDWLSVQHP